MKRSEIHGAAFDHSPDGATLDPGYVLRASAR
jgi:hypothetical protein